MYRSLNHYGMSVVAENDKYVVYDEGHYQFAVKRQELDRFEREHPELIPGYSDCFCNEVLAISDPTVLRNVLRELKLFCVDAAGICRRIYNSDMFF